MIVNLENVLYAAFLAIMCISVYVWIRIIKNTPNPEGSIYDKKAKLSYKSPIKGNLPPASSYL
jgi:hypothetical protein